MNMEKSEIEKTSQLIRRQRTKPRIWDYSYLLTRNNFSVFKQFKKIVDNENKTNIKVLDVGCGFKPWSNMFDKNRVEYIGVDYDRERASADIVSKADKLPFPSDMFDAFIYSESLEHAENIFSVLKEMRHVARDNALVFISAPFVFPEHGIPYDFQRLTRYFYQYVFRDDEIVLIRESNSSLSTTFVSFNLFIESTPINIPIKIIKGFKHLVFIFNNIIGIVADLIIESILKIIGNRFKEQFYAMPLGYALIVRIKK